MAVPLFPIDGTIIYDFPPAWRFPRRYGCAKQANMSENGREPSET